MITSFNNIVRTSVFSALFGISLLLVTETAKTAPEGGVVRAGNASINLGGSNTQINQKSNRAVIDWRKFNIAGNEQVSFNQPGKSSAILNRVTGQQLSNIEGRLNANGQVFLVNPHGIIFGKNAQINVGSLISSTSNISNKNFMEGRLKFESFSDLKTGIEQHGTITASEGGLVALVAPFVSNDGLIQARLGTVVLAASENFTLDLYGDELISLAISDTDARKLFDSQGNPVESLIKHSGKIVTDGGKTVLISATHAKSVLDQVINVSGIIQATSVVKHNGQIVLSGTNGLVDVSGKLDVSGSATGQHGGSIDVLADQIHLASTAKLDASGYAGGGEVHVGGDYQGKGSRYTAERTQIDADAQIDVSATEDGDAGKAIIWADNYTYFAGDIMAKGGDYAGDGGFVEVSGKSVLDFFGFVDASASNGINGQLLLDPAVVNIGLADAALISRVLRTGTSTSISANQNINVNAAIDGRGRYSGGGLTLTAGNNINVNDYILTENGNINLYATNGSITIAAAKALFSGTGAITLRSAENLNNAVLITSSSLNLTSTSGSVDLSTTIDPNVRSVLINAANSVSINQPVVSLRNGGSLKITAGDDIFVNAQIDGRFGSAGGDVTLTATDDIFLNKSIITNNGIIKLIANQGGLSHVSGTGLFAGNALIDISAFNSFSNPILSSSGDINLTSIAGSITVSESIASSVAALSLNAAQDVLLNKDIINLRTGSPLTVTAGRDIDVNKQIDGRGSSNTGGSATLKAGNNININENIITNDGDISLTASNGAITQAVNKQLRSGNGAITVSSASDLTTGSYVTTGDLNIESTAGSINIAEPIYETVGATSITANNDVNINNTVLNVRTLNSLTVQAGNDINVDAKIGQDRNAVTKTGAITLQAGGNVNVNEDVVSRDAALKVTATTGTVTVGAGKHLRSGSGSLSVTTGGDLSTDEYYTTGPLNITSTGGTVFIDTVIPETTGLLTIDGVGVTVNQNIITDQGVTINAGTTGFNMVGSEIDAQESDLNITSEGNILPLTLRSSANLNLISTDGQIIGGEIKNSRGTGFFPSKVFLSATQGINDFNTSSSPDVEAISTEGAIKLIVDRPGKLRITTFSSTAGDIITGGKIGSDVILSAARDVISPDLLTGGDLTFIAGRDVSITSPEYIISSLTINPAISDPRNVQNVVSTGDVNISSLSWLTDGDFWVNAGNDINITGPVHVSNTDAFTLSAGSNVTLGLAGMPDEQIEVLGAISITAQNGDITLHNDLGAHVPVSADINDWNMTDLGVGSIVLNALGTNSTINMQGARAEGDITISADTLNATKSITSINGIRTLNVNNSTVGVADVATVARIISPSSVAPGIPPGPSPLPPIAPLIPGALPPGAPTLPVILVGSPGNVDASTRSAPEGANNSEGSSETLAANSNVTNSNENQEDEQGEDEDEKDKGENNSNRGFVIFTGGRGVAQIADLGRSGSNHVEPNVFSNEIR